MDKGLECESIRFTKRKPSPVLDNEAVRWEMALRELAVESPVIHKTEE